MPHEIKLQIGDKAPDFEAKDQNGNIIKLNDLKGKRIVLYFYPKDNTPGCTAEACNFRDNYTALIKKGFVVLGVSADNEKSHQRFAQKYELPFSLLIDEDKQILEKYGVWGEKKMFGKIKLGIHRTTFVIDENGIIIEIFKKVQTKTHTEQILEQLENKK